MARDLPERPATDTRVPHSARIWNYWLGGKDYYAVDREAGKAYTDVFPAIVDIARAQRSFLARAVRFLAGEAGIRQFVDIGTGLPTAENTHEIAQRVAPESKVVYVDNDPLVLAHAQALLTSSPEGTTRCVRADVRDPAAILREAGRTLDLSRPVAVTILGVLGHVPDAAEAGRIVRHLARGLCPGSHLAVADSTDTDAAFRRAQQAYNDGGAAPYVLRSPEQIRQLFEGLEVLEPGVVPLRRWRPDGRAAGGDDIHDLCGVARRPDGPPPDRRRPV